MDECQKFDDNLFSILTECKTLPHFLDAVFGFLRRRTDFYCVATEKDSPVGLPPGWSENFVKQSYFKWKPNDGKPKDEVANKTSKKQVEKESVDKKVQESLQNEIKAINVTESSTTKSEHQFTSSESYNGAKYDNYSWAQTIKEVDISVKVPPKVTTKELSVSIQAKRISVKLKNGDIALLEGELCQKCKHSDAIWSLDNSKMDIHLEKCSEMWWDCLVLSEPKLDVSKIDCSRPFEDLSDEAQAKIEELTWNQERKRLGLPTSEELVMQEKLKKAWNVEGSPFKGQFDPSSVILN